MRFPARPPSGAPRRPPKREKGLPRRTATARARRRRGRGRRPRATRGSRRWRRRAAPRRRWRAGARLVPRRLAARGAASASRSGRRLAPRTATRPTRRRQQRHPPGSESCQHFRRAHVRRLVSAGPALTLWHLRPTVLGIRRSTPLLPPSAASAARSPRHPRLDLGELRLRRTRCLGPARSHAPGWRGLPPGGEHWLVRQQAHRVAAHDLDHSPRRAQGGRPQPSVRLAPGAGHRRVLRLPPAEHERRAGRIQCHRQLVREVAAAGAAPA